MIARGRYTQVLDAALAQEAVRHSEPRADFGQARKTWIAVRDQVPLVTIVRTTLRWRELDSNSQSPASWLPFRDRRLSQESVEHDVVAGR